MSARRANAIVRAFRKLRQAGWPGIRATLDWRWQRLMRDRSPVLWAQFGALSRMVGQALPIAQPPIVVLSLPRSGSSWVGQTLGLAPNAAYLREPLDQLFLAQRSGGTVRAFEGGTPPAAYQWAAALTFSGVPAFPRRLGIVADPRQWSLAGRRRRHVVTKLVNPFTAPWLLEAYAPRLIYLVRHPAALALSFRKLGWWSTDPEIWLKVGRSYHDAHQALLAAAAGQATVHVVQYEALCREPLRHFRALFEFAGLTFTAPIAASIAQQTSGGDDGAPYSLARNSAAQIDKWRSLVQPHELAELRAGYCHSPLPWYQSAADWQLSPVTHSGQPA